MNYELLKNKIDDFFERTSSETIISQLEDMGYEFEDIESFEFGEDFTESSSIDLLKLKVKGKLNRYSSGEEDSSYPCAA